MEPVRRFLARRTTSALAEDALAETLLVSWRRLDEVPAEPLPWVYGVARNCLANVERSQRRQGALTTRLARNQPTIATPEGEPGRVLALHEALLTLRPDEAELVRLWAWERLTPAEIAAVLGLTSNAVSIRLHRAKGKLREELRKIDARAGHE
jgi:RNA polymerase sigma-70 factor (ECF subfamily)